MCDLRKPGHKLCSVNLRKYVKLLSCNRKYSTCFVTTPIFYVNAAPHIGHLYSALLADAYHRYYILKHPNEKTIFATGTDEHGLKVQQAAGSDDLRTVKGYCDQISTKYKNLFDKCGIKYTNYIRTTDDNHTKSVQHFWNVLKQKDFIYMGSYAGWYCVSDEMFLTEQQIENQTNADGKEIKVSTLSGHGVEWTEEENFMFRLSKVQSDLVNWLEDSEKIVPNNFHQLVQSWMSDEHLFKDISVSRPTSRIPWGIPVPDCPSHTVYVWLDALVNYLSVAEYPNLTAWPPSVQVLGKDILKFHAIYWPAFLLAAGLNPPRKLFVHSHWTVDDMKMSKSKNNVVDPHKKVDFFSVSGFRYFLLKQGVPHNDGNYNDLKVLKMVNADLSNTLGNLLNRSSAEEINIRKVYPAFDKDEFQKLQNENSILKELSEKLCVLQGALSKHYDELHFYRGIQSILEVLYLSNKFFDECKPWKMSRNPKKYATLECIIHITYESLRICSIGLCPIVPNISSDLFIKLNIPQDRRIWDAMNPSWNDPSYKTITIPIIRKSISLYKRLGLKKKF